MFGDDILLGTEVRTTDSKNRVILPSNFGTEGGEPYYFVLDEEQKKLSLYALKTIELQVKEQRAALNSCEPSALSEKQKEFENFFESIIFGGKVDKEHRILLPKRATKVIGIEPKEPIKFVGYGDHIKISKK